MSNARESEWERDFARAMNEFDKVATKAGRPLFEFVKGRWSKTRPNVEGVYRLRWLGTDPVEWVAYIDVSPGSVFSAADELEFFHLDRDADGSPTRWDDPSIAEEAVRNGWRPPQTRGDGRTRRN